MSRLLAAEEIGRQLRAVPGWRYELGALRASYRAPDFPGALRLVAELGAEAESMDHHPDVDLRWRTVHLRCSTHTAGGVTQLDVELAHRAHEWAARIGAEPVAGPPTLEIAVDAADPALVLPFWREALGYREAPGPGSTVELRDPHGSGPTLWFQVMDPPRPGRSRVHLDVYLPPDEATARLDRLLSLGGRLADERHAPHWWVVADAEGNEVCLCVGVPPEA